ncbi:MAG: tetratricopeptide repeat protein [Phycisphaerae bacterium]|nr:tetratricopeptide repeat protein [Phycisphaerae bacterium]
MRTVRVTCGWGINSKQIHPEASQADDSPERATEFARLTGAESPELRELAATCYALAAKVENPRDMAVLLQGEDPVAASFCEQALWSRWFYAAGQDAAAELHEAMTCLSDGRTLRAMELLEDLIDRWPDYAEAYHQRGMAHTLRDDHNRALEDFLSSVQLNPLHFTAMANLGHCCVQLGRYEAARDWYLAALRVHPRLPGIRQMIRQLSEFRRSGAGTRLTS